MTDALLDPLRPEFAQRALLELLVLSVACGPLGVWVVAFRQSYAAESFSHGLLPGLVGATLAGVPPAAGAAAGALAAAGGTALAGRVRGPDRDAAVAVTVTALVGAGALLGLAPDAPARLQDLLFGDLLGADGRDVGIAVGLAGGVALALLAGHRRLALAAFDPAAARSLGVPAARMEAALLAGLALATVAAVQGLGSLLVLALLVAPGAAALRLARRLGPALALAAGLAAAAGIAGLYASYHLELAAGASVALAAVAIYGAVALIRPARAGQRTLRPGPRGARAGPPPGATPGRPPTAPGSGAGGR
jgi:ABC-type Mn2+/Zn2+ transport system permease subunit